MEDRNEYFFTYRTNVKERWKNKRLLNVLVDEFRTRDREYFMEAIKCGVITVNNEIVKPTKILKLTDFINHTVHMHEPTPPKIDILYKEDSYVVVNKPAGIPCHPTGGYINYSVTKHLFGDRKVACVNRLDMPVSGVLIIAYNDLANCLAKIRDATKYYIAKVKGNFYDYIEVDASIACKEGRSRFVSEKGKKCLTIFKKIKYSNGFSLVECKPITGRTHQIRIHLQSIGFPILNDICYGDNDDPIDDEMIANEIDKSCNLKIVDGDEKLNCITKYCKGKNNRSFDIRKNFICLHAFKYIYNGKEYVTDFPSWASF